MVSDACNTFGMGILQSMYRHPRAWGRWLFREPRLVWLALLAIAGTWPTMQHSQAWPLKSYGFALQSLGVVIAARALFNNERLFRLERLRDRITAWWQRMPGKPVFAALMGVQATMKAGTLRASG